MKIADLSIGKRLGFGFGTILVLMATMVVIGIVVLRTMEDKLKHIVRIENQAVKNAQITSEATINITSAIKTIAMVDDENTQRDGQTEIDEARKSYKEAMAKLESLDKTEKGKELIAEIKALLAEGKPINNKVIELANVKKNAEVINIMVTEMQPNKKKLKNKFAELLRYEEERTSAEYEEARKSSERAFLFLVVIGAVSFIVGIAMAVFLTKGITRPLAQGVWAANRLSEGDLTIDIACNSNDETGRLLSAMNAMVEKLRTIVSKVTETSVQIASAANQLHSTSAQIATGAEEVASQVNTVATASEEMSATSSDIARNCNMVADASRQTTESATAAAAVVQETINGMNVIADRVRQTSKTIDALGTRSEQIGQIVGTIEDIADQTNLLALNAAIEAARAGEQGRGFAVVADEVRALAVRTTKATREIGEMIKSIQKETQEAVKAMEEGVHEVEKGAVSSQKSGQALEDILERINEVTMQVNQIATAAEEQTATTGDVTSNIQQITEVVHHAAQGSEETAAAAAQLAVQAQELQNLVSRFQLV